jgi:hypothetical protein
MKSRRADSNRLPLLITSDRSAVAGVCTGLQIRISKRLFSAAGCCVLQRIAFPVVSEWYQKATTGASKDSYVMSGLSILTPVPQREGTPHLWIATLPDTECRQTWRRRDGRSVGLGDLLWPFSNP